MFHVRDGLFFEKQADGAVRILKRTDGRDDAPVVFDMVLDKHSWASVIATMSFYGEESYGYFRALLFHDNLPLPSGCVLREILPAMLGQESAAG